MKRYFVIFLLFVMQVQGTVGEEKKPNIIFFLMDDLDKVVMERFYPKLLPSAIKLQEEGVKFKNAFVANSICCPSRATILSGLYPHNTSVFTNVGKYGGRQSFLHEDKTIATILQGAGYQTFMAGKYLNGFHFKGGGELPKLPLGWDEGHVFVDGGFAAYRGYNYHLPNWKNGKQFVGERGSKEEDYSTDVIKSKAINYLQSYVDSKNSKPFFMYLTPTCTHLPLPPASRHMARATDFWEKNPLPTNRPNFYKVNLNEVPSWLRDSWTARTTNREKNGYLMARIGGLPPNGYKSSDLSWNQMDWFLRVGNIMACDEFINEMVELTKKNGLFKNTVFIVTSDNGYNLGAHGLINKMAPYEESVRVPLFIAGGSDTKIKKGFVEKEWVSNIDFMPTIIELARVENPYTVDGLSYAKFIKEGSALPENFHEELFTEYVSGGVTTDFEHPRLSALTGTRAYFIKDIPSFRAIRIRRAIDDSGVKKEIKFIVWDKGEPTAVKIPFTADYEKEFEMFNVSDDPYEMHNLFSETNTDKWSKLKDELMPKLDVIKVYK